MRRASVLLQIAFALIVFAPAMAEEHDAIFDNVAGKMCFRDLLRDSGWSLNGPWERAAFVMQQADGSITCQCWPSKHSYLAEQFSGVIPAQTIAIVHTHPVQYPRPSENDKQEATRLGIPIYVLTIQGVYKAVPGAREAATLTTHQAWLRQVPNKAPTGLASAAP
ncbi:MAG: Mov34/MPN/PAD-1 family protein [Acidobacteriota bacterium]|nr:Mov34/MPN/PAD-1 family protein [Acidobacteriota bacterium]